MKKFKSDLVFALVLAIVICLLVTAITNTIVIGIASFIISFSIMSLCSYINRGIHQKLFSDEYL